MHRVMAWVVLLGACYLSAQTANQSSGQQHQSPFAKSVTAQQIQSAYLHGTIDVVVSTKDGFVLATDSRATSSDGSHSDDAQKAFAVGSRAGCVVAGLIGAEMHMEGFELRDAMGTHLTGLGERASRENRPVSATEIERTFSSGLDDVAGLLLPSREPQLQPSIVGAVSAVSISPDGQAEWVTFYLPVDMRSTQTGAKYYYSIGSPIYMFRPLTLGLRFDIQALGFPFIAEQMLKANGPANDSFSSSPIMQKFYDRKRSGHLDEFTLPEAVDLAKVLVRATIALAPAEAGVGGAIDILSVTNTGVHWVERKQTSAPFPPPIGVSVAFNEMSGGNQRLDGFQCVRCTFHDTKFTYAGNGDVQLLGSTFDGRCQLTVLPGARQRMPMVVNRLERFFAGKCATSESP